MGIPALQYNITVRVLEFSGIDEDEELSDITPSWHLVSQFQLSPSKTAGRSENGKVSTYRLLCLLCHYFVQVVAQLQGDLLGVNGPIDLSYKYLLVPTLTHWRSNTKPPQYTVSIKRTKIIIWLLCVFFV